MQEVERRRWQSHATCVRGYVEQFEKRGCCSIGGDRSSSLGGKRERGGCGRWAMEDGGNSEMRAEAEVRKLRISWCFLP